MRKKSLFNVEKESAGFEGKISPYSDLHDVINVLRVRGHDPDTCGQRALDERRGSCKTRETILTVVKQSDASSQRVRLKTSERINKQSVCKQNKGTNSFASSYDTA